MTIKDSLMELNQVMLLKAFSDIMFYQGYEDWVKEVADKLNRLEESKTLMYGDVLDPKKDWGTDKHALWMMLCSAFGDWGSSIRTGWIDKPYYALKFIEKALEELEDKI